MGFLCARVQPEVKTQSLLRSFLSLRPPLYTYSDFLNSSVCELLLNVLVLDYLAPKRGKKRKIKGQPGSHFSWGCGGQACMVLRAATVAAGISVCTSSVMTRGQGSEHRPCGLEDRGLVAHPVPHKRCPSCFSSTCTAAQLKAESNQNWPQFTGQGFPWKKLQAF